MDIKELATALNEKTDDDGLDDLLKMYIEAKKNGISDDQLNAALADTKWTAERLKKALNTHSTLGPKDKKDSFVKPPDNNTEQPSEPDSVLKQWQQRDKNSAIDLKIEKFLKNAGRDKEAALWMTVGWKLNKTQKGCVFGHIMLDHTLIKIKKDKVGESTQLDEWGTDIIKGTAYAALKHILKGGGWLAKGGLQTGKTGMRILSALETQSVKQLATNIELSTLRNFVKEQAVHSSKGKVKLTDVEAATFLKNMHEQGKIVKTNKDGISTPLWVNPKNVADDLKPWLDIKYPTVDISKGIKSKVSKGMHNQLKNIKKLGTNFEQRLMDFAKKAGTEDAKKASPTIMRILGNHRKKVIGGGILAATVAFYHFRMPCGDFMKTGNWSAIQEKMAEQGVGFGIKGVEVKS